MDFHTIFYFIFGEFDHHFNILMAVANTSFNVMHFMSGLAALFALPCDDHVRGGTQDYFLESNLSRSSHGKSK